MSLGRYRLGGFIRVLLNAWLNYSAVMINHSNTNLTTIKQIIGSMLLASSHLNTNIYIFVGGFSNIVSYLTSTLDVWGSSLSIVSSHQKKRAALTKSSALETVSRTIKREQYCHYEWGLSYTMPASSYKITGDSRTSTYRSFSIMISKPPPWRGFSNIVSYLTSTLDVWESSLSIV